MEGQSKRNNLVFHAYGIPEENDETWDDREAAVRKILEEKMGMEEAWRGTDIAIERAHRIGRFSRDETRPIIVKVANYKHKNNVLNISQSYKAQIIVSKNNSATELHKKESLFNL